MRALLILWFSLVFAPLAWAAAPITAAHATIAMVPGQKAAAGYLSLQNSGAKDAILTSITSDCCDSVEMHTMLMQGDIMRMRAIEKVVIPAGGTVEFAPGGDHVMFIGFRQSPTPAAPVTATLHFADGSALPVDFTIALRGHP